MTEAPQPQGHGPRVGTLLAERFRVLEVIGRGGMGIVVRAYDKVTKTEVAVKHVRPDLGANPDYADRLLREASLARDVSHHNVCRVHDVYRDGDEVLLSMEYVQGENLRRRLDRGPLSDQEAVHIARQICAGVAAAHGKGVVHRDLKPENVLIDTSGRVVVLDFGVARREGTPRDTVTGIALGTPRYMSPEQQQGKAVTPASDVYALGLVIEELFGDRRPPSWLRPIIRRATDRDPRRRYRDAAALGRLLARPWLRLSFLGLMAGTGLAAVATLTLIIHPSLLLGLLRLLVPEGILGPGPPVHEPQRTILTRQWGGAQFGTVSPDGKLLAYIQENNGVQEGLLRPLRDTTSEPRRFSPPGLSVTWISFAPDSRTLAFATGGHFLDGKSVIYLAELGAGATPRQVTLGSAPSWFPDGQTLVFSRYNPDTARFHLARIPAAGGTVTPIETDPPARRELAAAVSPDGKRIAYIGGPSPGGLRVIPAGGGAAVTLDDHPLFYDRVHFTPDGRRILYGSERGNELLAIPVDGGGPAVTVLPGIDLPHQPSLTADGSLLLYTRAQMVYQLWLADRDGKNPVLVRVDTPTDYLGWPLFSPDGKHMALMIGLESKEQVMLLPSNGGTGKILLHPRPGAARPESFADDGRALIIGNNQAGGLQVVPLGAAPVPKIVFDRSEVFAAVSPDGKLMATTRLEGRQGTVASGLWVRPVLAPPGEARCWVDNGVDRPAWSADSRQLAVGTSKGEVAVSRGPEQTRYFQFRDSVGAPLRPRMVRFSPDGRLFLLENLRLYEANLELEEAQLVLQPRRISNLFGFGISPDGSQLAYVTQQLNSDLWMLESPLSLILARHASRF